MAAYTTEVPKETGTYKFVKVNGEYRFVDSGMGKYHHIDCLNDDESTDEAESAGSISIIEGSHWTMWQSYSSTLGVSATQEDFDYLNEAIGLPEGGF